MSIIRRMDKENVLYIHNGIYTAEGMDEIVPFEATWKDLEGITLSELRLRKINTVGFHS